MPSRELVYENSEGCMDIAKGFLWGGGPTTMKQSPFYICKKILALSFLLVFLGFFSMVAPTQSKLDPQNIRYK